MRDKAAPFSRSVSPVSGGTRFFIFDAVPHNIERFAFEKAEREAAVCAARPGVSGKNAFFPRDDRPYGLKRKAFQTEKLIGRLDHEAHHQRRSAFSG